MDTNELLKKRYLTESEVEEVTGRKKQTLRNDRHLRRGFPYLRVGKRAIRYLSEDITKSMESQRISFEA